MKRTILILAALVALALPAFQPPRVNALTWCGHTLVGSNCRCGDPGCICNPPVECDE